MSRYLATIVHSSIKRARVIECGNILSAAKAKATREFGDEFGFYTIQIYDREGYASADVAYLPCVAARKVYDKKWKEVY